MDNKRKKELEWLLRGVFIISGLLILFNISVTNSWIYLLAILIISHILPGIIVYKLIPDKRQGKSNSTKNTKLSNSTTSKKNLSVQELLTADIDTLEGDDFERLVFLYFKAKGFNPELTQKTGDHGVDLVIKDPNDGLKIAVQCKRYKSDSKIGNKDIINLEGGKRFYRCPGTMFITTSDYTPKAREFAEQCKMDLWNRAYVENKIGQWRKSEAKKRNLVS